MAIDATPPQLLDAFAADVRARFAAVRRRLEAHAFAVERDRIGWRQMERRFPDRTGYVQAATAAEACVAGWDPCVDLAGLLEIGEALMGELERLRAELEPVEPARRSA